MAEPHAIGSLEVRVSQILRAGVLIAAAVILAGVLLFFATGSTGWVAAADPVAAFARAPEAAVTFPRTLPEVGRELLAGHSGGVIQLGLLLLMTLPGIRVLATIVLFLQDGERVHATIATVVLVLLVIAALGSGLE